MRRIVNSLVAVVAWLVFAWMWWYAFRNIGPARNQVRDVLLVAALSLLVVAVTGLWVAWSIRLWRKTGRRITPAAGRHDYGTDTAGRAVIADFARLRTARYVVIGVEDAGATVRKRYNAPDNQEPTEDEVAACPL